MIKPTIERLNYLKELEELNLDKSRYTIIGSGIMAVCGIRENDDIDISVTEDLFDEISEDDRFAREDYPPSISYRYKHISIFKGNFPMTDSPQQLIDESITVNGYNFISIETLTVWKGIKGRPKDEEDLKILLSRY